LIAYLLIGTVVLQSIDESIAKEDFPPALLFTFTTIATIGYGSIYPTTDIGKVCCIGYCVIGIPLIFLVLSNNGQFLVDAYWIIRKSSGGKVRLPRRTFINATETFEVFRVQSQKVSPGWDRCTSLTLCTAVPMLFPLHSDNFLRLVRSMQAL
uniref:Ion_trans_2 domain-containing protein n=1 Tax=Nippostrongylus brasiliensis TaxID=27835 RepID=A0A0N4XP45_NIPBR